MSRLFVLDPVCAMEYGHSLNGLNYFADMAARHFNTVIKVASRHLPGRTGDDGIERMFEFHYGFALKIKRAIEPWHLIEAAHQHTNACGTAAADFVRLLARYDMDASDTLMFPSIDYFSLAGVLAVLNGRPPAHRPHLLIRLIGVMELAVPGKTPEDALAHICAQLQTYLAEGGQVTLAAETPKYAQKLSALIGAPVQTVPCIVADFDALPLPQSGPITFLAGGSARPDKGFFRLKPIIDLVHAEIDPKDVRFVIQGLPDHLTYAHRADLRALTALPNTTLLPGQIPYDAVRQSFAESHVTLMPYDAEIYMLRGSAMLMETMLFGRLAICQDSTAFAEQAQLYGAGVTCTTDEEFAAAICRYARMAPDQLGADAAQARKHYLGDVENACQAWLSEALA